MIIVCHAWLYGGFTEIQSNRRRKKLYRTNQASNFLEGSFNFSSRTCPSIFTHSHKEWIVWKHAPNWPFCTLMLRTKLYQNPFFFTGDQIVTKSKSRAVRIVYGPIFLPFYKIIVSFFSFFCQDANKTRSNCAIIDCNLSKKHKLILYKTQNGEPNCIDYKFFFDFCQELPVQKLEDTSKDYRADQLVGARIV